MPRNIKLEHINSFRISTQFKIDMGNYLNKGQILFTVIPLIISRIKRKETNDFILLLIIH